MEQISCQKMFGGEHQRYKHQSQVCDCEMTFAVFLPPQAEQDKVPVLYWLSGLTCNDENFSSKAGAQRVAAELGIALVMPDTSPRGVSLPGEDDSYDFGSAAGFYLNATQSPWSKHYNMYDYVVNELPQLVNQHFAIDGQRASISGHSMGGHGALTIGLKNPQAYRSVSAFSPIVAPMQVPWGQKALAGYLGDDQQGWKQYDAVQLISDGAKPSSPLLVDQGAADDFLQEHLRPELLQAACETSGVEVTVRMQAGYDHSYFFIATFIEDHVRFHAKYLRAS